MQRTFYKNLTLMLVLGFTAASMISAHAGETDASQTQTTEQRVLTERDNQKSVNVKVGTTLLYWAEFGTTAYTWNEPVIEGDAIRFQGLDRELQKPEDRYEKGGTWNEAFKFVAQSPGTSKIELRHGLRGSARGDLRFAVTIVVSGSTPTMESTEKPVVSQTVIVPSNVSEEYVESNGVKVKGKLLTSENDQKSVEVKVGTTLLYWVSEGTTAYRWKSPKIFGDSVQFDGFATKPSKDRFTDGGTRRMAYKFVAVDPGISKIEVRYGRINSVGDLRLSVIIKVSPK